jgi:hypothetical protein
VRSKGRGVSRGETLGCMKAETPLITPARRRALVRMTVVLIILGLVVQAMQNFNPDSWGPKVAMAAAAVIGGAMTLWWKYRDGRTDVSGPRLPIPPTD